MSAYTDRVEHGLEGLEAVSTGLCPGCAECARNYGMEPAAFDDAWHSGKVYDEGHFSWSPCGICDSHLGGTREAWHAIMDGKLVHFDDACVDCVAYLANGTEPD